MRIVLVILCAPLAACWIAQGDDYEAAVCGDGDKRTDEGETCDDGNRRDGDGCSADCLVEARIDATWTVQRYDGTIAGCPVDFPAVVLTAATRGATQVKAFLCEDGKGTMKLEIDGGVDAPVVQPTLSLVSADRMSTFSVARTDHRYETRPSAAIDFKLYTDAGYFSLIWISCGTTNDMQITATSKTSPFTMTWTVDCSLKHAVEVVPLGDYTVTLFDGVHSGQIDITVTSLTEILDAHTVPQN